MREQSATPATSNGQQNDAASTKGDKKRPGCLRRILRAFIRLILVLLVIMVVVIFLQRRQTATVLTPIEQPTAAAAVSTATPAATAEPGLTKGNLPLGEMVVFDAGKGAKHVIVTPLAKSVDQRATLEYVLIVRPANGGYHLQVGTMLNPDSQAVNLIDSYVFFVPEGEYLAVGSGDDKYQGYWVDGLFTNDPPPSKDDLYGFFGFYADKSGTQYLLQPYP